MPIKKLLIANRGEIALRIHRACHEMGIKTVAVHSTADADAMHVRLADEAVCIGPPPAKDSYLNIANIISAAEITHADAIHPGYGFLSENAQFAEIVESHDIIWVGPKPEHIRIMGDKIEAKRTAAKLGLPLVPGSDGPLDQLAEAQGDRRRDRLSGADQGRVGRRRARHEGRAERGPARKPDEPGRVRGQARRSATTPSIIEKYLGDPRHIEFQVFGDGNGKAIHLGERDCSIQRRHQKVLEEAPSPVITAEQRERDGRDRRQGDGRHGLSRRRHDRVPLRERRILLHRDEHPAAGRASGDRDDQRHRPGPRADPRRPGRRPVGARQDEIQLHGHAIECRINAEDPQTFAPSPGLVKNYVAPGGMHVRVDSGLYAGYRVPPYYDSMIGKLIVYGIDPRALHHAPQARARGIRGRGHEDHHPAPPAASSATDAFLAGDYTIKWLEHWLESQQA